MFNAKRVLGFALITIIWVLLFIPLSFGESTDKQNEPLQAIAVFHCDYPPVSFMNKSTNSPSGFFIDIMEKVAVRANLQVSYICKNGWAEMVSAVESGEADFGVLLKTKERENKLLFSSPIDITYLSFFARSQSSMDAYKLTKDQTVGVIRGSSSYEKLKNWPQIKLVLYGSYQDGIFGLLSGEISLFAGEESMILKRARETNLEDRIKKVGKSFDELTRGLAIGKNNIQLLAMLDKSLSNFIGGPEYQKIYLKWYGKPAPYWTEKKILIVSAIFLFIVICCMALWRYISISKLNADLEKLVKQRTEEAMKATHLASLGELAAGVAHEVNNPVNSIINYAQMLDDAMTGSSREKDIISRIIKEGNRIAMIVSSLLSYGREQVDGKKTVSINMIINEALNLMGTQLKKDHIHLNIEMEKSIPEVTTNPQQLQQVFMNLISNSRHALNSRYPGPHKDKKIEVLLKMVTTNDMPCVRIDFTDYGTGIKPDIIDKVMNPFFTTKPLNQGTGLGLSISRGIIENLEGKFSIESEEGKYTRATIELPI